MKKKIFWSILGILVLGFIVYAFLPKPVPVDLVFAKHGPLRVTVDEDGKTRVKERYVISAPLNGLLLRISLKEGDRVETGKTPVAVIEPRISEFLDARTTAQAEARVKAAKAARQRAVHDLGQFKVEMEYAGTQLERMKRLFARKMVSRKDLDDAEERARFTKENLNSAQFAVRVAEFELEQARATLLQTGTPAPEAGNPPQFTVMSPIDGAVLRVFQESETPVTAGTRLVEIGNTSDVEVVIDVLSSDAVRIRPGARTILEHWGGDAPLEGRVRKIEPGGFTKISALGVEEQRVNVIADLTGPVEKWNGLADGYRVDARVVVSELADVLKIPAGALFRQAGEWSVFVVEDGKARVRPVKIGEQNDLEAEIRDGLKENDRVIVYPGDKVKDGGAVSSRQEK